MLAGGRSRTDLVGGPRIGFGPGITSGLGCVLAPVRHDFVQSIGQPLADAATAHIDGSFADQAASGRRLLEEDGVPVAEIVVRHEADLLFRGQSHVFRVPVTAPGFDPWPTTTPFDLLRHVQFPGAHSKIHRWNLSTSAGFKGVEMLGGRRKIRLGVRKSGSLTVAQAAVDDAADARGVANETRRRARSVPHRLAPAR